MVVGKWKFSAMCLLLFLALLADGALAGAAFAVAYRQPSVMQPSAVAKRQPSAMHSSAVANQQPSAMQSSAVRPLQVALTFDDGPNPKYTKPLLDGLRERGIRVTFFLVGECIDGNEDLVKQMAKDGHLIGVHCLTHKDLTKEKLSDAAKELCDTREKIRAVTGDWPEYVRPPYGSWNAKLEEAVDMIPVFWDVDSIDWRLKNTEKVTAKVVKDTEDGDIILMHDEFKTSVEAAFRIIDNLTAKGYTFVTVDELMVD